jgi:hypothetical protein
LLVFVVSVSIAMLLRAEPPASLSTPPTHA